MVSTAFLTATGAVASTAMAQRPSNISICDYYSTALLNVSNATTQLAVVTLVVNTAIIGNYSSSGYVPGILAKDAKYNGTTVNLAPYFDGSLMSTNDGGDQGKSVSFLDGGGAAPLMKNMPANDKHSHQ